MKVLHVHNSAVIKGGLEVNLMSLSIGLQAVGWRNHLAVALPPKAEWSGGGEFLRAFDSGVSNASDEFESVIRSFDPDVVLIHKLNDPRAVSRLSRLKPTTAYLHDYDVICPRTAKYYPFSRRICTSPVGLACIPFGCLLKKGEDFPVGLHPLFGTLRLRDAYRNLSTVIVGSAWMQSQLEVNGFLRDRILIQPPLSVGDPNEGLPRGWSRSRRILFVGQLINGKGVDLLLKACALLRGPWTLDIVGSGKSSRALQALVDSLGLKGRIRFAGKLSHAETNEYYRQAQVVVVPSRWAEPFGMVGLEAMRWAKPVVAFKVGGIPDWCVHEETGLLCEPADVKALSLAIQRVLDSESLSVELGSRGLKRWNEKYQFPDYVRNMARILQETADSTRRQ